MVINPYIFKREPNTFIGGIAKLGGTGANAPILTAAELASKMGISESIIKGFKVVGEDVECRITSDYNLIQYAFGNQISGDANQNITFFNDIDNKCIGANRYSFGNCSNLLSVVMNGLKKNILALGVGTNGGIFNNCTSLVSAELNSLESMNCFRFMYSAKITNLNLPSLEIILDTVSLSYRNFQNMTELNILSARKLKQIGTDPSIDYLNFNGIKLNATIEVHIDLATANNGDIDADLLYAYTSRNATINFYDDNGNFVETYNPNPGPLVEIDWTIQEATGDNAWQSIASNNKGIWIAVANTGSNRVMRSIDNGLTWSATTGLSGEQWKSIDTDGEGVWVAVSSGGTTNRIMRSSDNGLTWSYITPPQNNFWFSVATDRKGVWVAVSTNGTSRIMRSTDNGLTWSAIVAPVVNTWFSVATDMNGVWIAVTLNSSNRIIRSEDNGLTWSVVAAEGANILYSIASGIDNVWIAVGNSIIVRSEDNGLTWTSVVLGNTMTTVSTNGKGDWVALSQNGVNRIAVSLDDGETWNLHSSIEDNNWTSIKCNSNGLWIGVSSDGTNRILKGVETYNTNPELYTQNDACSTGANETESVGAGWIYDGGILVTVESSTESNWCLKFEAQAISLGEGFATISISGLEIGETYEISLDGRAEDATGLLAGQGFIRTDINNGWASLAYVDIDSFNWQHKSFNAVATDTDAILEYYPSFTASGIQADWSGFLDNISIKKIS